MTTPSVLEWILIAAMGTAVLIYCIISIAKIIDKKKHPEKYKKKKEKEEEELDE